MKRLKPCPIVLAFFLVLSSFGTAKAVNEDLPFIRVSLPVMKDFRRTVSFMGKVVPKTKVEVVARVSGQIVSVHVADETRIKKGDLLFTLGGPEVEKTLKAFEVRLKALRKEIALAEEAVRLKDKGVKAKIVPYGELLSAKEHLLSLEAELEALKAELTSFKAGLQVKAPISGIFTRRRVSIGQDVEKGTVLAEVVDPQALWIKATVFLPHKTPLCGKSALIKAQSHFIRGQVTRVSPQHTSAGGTVVFLEGKEIFRNFAPGQTVSGEIILEEHKGALALPAEAVVYDEEERAYVFVKSGRAFKKRRVKTGLADNGFIEIVSGLKGKEEVVIQGAYELFHRNFNQIYKVPD